MRRHKNSVGIVAIGTLALIWTTVLTLAAERPAVRASLLNFSSADNKYRSGLTAIEYASLLQVAVSDLPGVEWLERSQIEAVEAELHLSALGGVDRASALRQGNALGAEFVVTGEFATNAWKRWELKLEIIDIRRADLLISTNIPCVVSADSPLRQVLAEMPGQLTGIRAFLTAGAGRYRDLRAVPALAILGFDQRGITTNRGEAPDFPAQLLSELPRAAQAGGLRVVDFTRTDGLAGENARILAGITRGDADLWNRVADAYVWGVCDRRRMKFMPAEESTWGHTVSLHLLNGTKETILVRSNVPQDRLPKVTAELAAEVVRLAGQHASGAPTFQQRKQAASALKQSAGRELGSLQEEASGLAKLQALLFLDPADQEASEDYLLTKYQRDFEIGGPDHRMISRRNYRFLRDSYDAFVGHIKKFGAGTVGAARVQGAAESGTQESSRFIGPMALLRSLQLLDYVRDCGMAYDTAPQVKEQLVATLQPEVLALARKVASLPETKPYLPLLPNLLPRNAYTEADKKFAADFRSAIGAAPAPPAPAARRENSLAETQVRLHTGEIVEVIPPEKLFPTLTVADVLEEMQATPDPGGFWRTSSFHKFRALTLDKLAAVAERGDAEAAYVLGWSHVILYAGSSFEGNEWKPGFTPQMVATNRTYSNEGVRGLFRGAYGKVGRASLEQGKPWMRRAAEAGMIEAEASLGMFYTTGNFGEAEQWLKKAADRNHRGAAFELGHLLWVGKLDDRNISAMPDKTPTGRWWLKAANLGHPGAPAALVEFLESGFGRNLQGCDSNLVNFIEAELGRSNPGAAYALAAVHDLGLGVPQNPTLALKWYRTTLESGTTPMQKEWTERRTRELTLTVSGPEAAIAALRDQAAKGSLISQFQLGKALLQARDEKSAAEWLLKAARSPTTLAESSDQDSYIRECSFLLGELYEAGRGVGQDYRQALNWYEKAQERGEHMFDAKYRLVRLYELGLGVKPDYERTLELYLELVRVGYRDRETTRDLAERATLLLRSGKLWPGDSARINSALAQFQPHLDETSIIRLSAGGPPADPVKARAHYQEIAETRQRIPACIAAQKKLAHMFFQGEGGPQDIRKGFNWLAEAAQSGDAEAFHLIGQALEQWKLGPDNPADRFVRRAYVNYSVAEALGYQPATPKKAAIAQTLAPFELTAAGHEIKAQLNELQATAKR